MPYTLRDIPEKQIEAMWKQRYHLSVPTNEDKDTVVYDQYQLFRDSVREQDMPMITGEGFILSILVVVAIFMFLNLMKEIYQEYS